MKELDESDVGRGALLPTMLLGIEIVIAKLESGVVAMNNRCPHRSSKLHLGWNTGKSVKCAYHGWEYGTDGQCVSIPAAPDGPIPKRACATTYDCEVKYGLVWVRIDGSADTQIPEHLAYDNPKFRSVLGPSYNWKTHSARRIENYTDLAHFPFIHPNTLGSAGHVTFLTPKINFRKEGKLRYRYDAPKGGRHRVRDREAVSGLLRRVGQIRSEVAVKGTGALRGERRRTSARRGSLDHGGAAMRRTVDEADDVLVGVREHRLETV